MGNKIKIALVDDQQLFRESLAALLDRVPEFELLAVCENGKAFMDQLAALPNEPEVVLVDMNMPEMNGVELTELLHKTRPEMKIIILTVYDQERFMVKMIEAGACGYLLKNCGAEEVINAIRQAQASGYYFNEFFRNAVNQGAKYRSAVIRDLNHIPIELSEREKEVLLLICQELTNVEIGEKLFISSRTVDGHRNNLLAKTGARNTAGLVVFAVTNDLFQILPR
jgi:DNA-binding NarL/FixJ family response regulator